MTASKAFVCEVGYLIQVLKKPLIGWRSYLIMLRFRIRSTMGDLLVSHCREDFLGVHGSFFVLANDRVDAFIKLFRWLTEAGNDVTVLDTNRSESPLSFSSSDVAVID